ncbi:hypothetical protein LS71_008425 [Helicobacter jaachi]|uniref:VirB3 type IV secretion protein n=1 Tax=Helicobacter jaachi TaxID=1677920 RepID=A0A4U8T704_9HELI|nr:hypothetical protein LS71_008425 [Helicobacter jaachi]
MLNVYQVTTENIRELTKKEKFLRLNIKSWAISAIGSLALNSFLGLYTLVLFIVAITFFYIIEFFDDDIVDIALNTLQLKTGIGTYYA